MAIRHRNEHNIAVMMSFIPANAALLADVVQQEGSIFADVIRFDQFSGLSKRQQRLKRTKVLQAYLAKHPATRLFTGTDRNVEFQYAMHLARKHNPAATINGTRGPKLPSSPPMAGPMTKPNPKAAPIIPKFFARSSGKLISAM